MRYAFASFAMADKAWKDGDSASEGGDGSSVSAYDGKYWQPYGELKHSGRTITFAPAFEASSTLSRACDRFTALSAPGVGGKC
jgi:hypothetical protein